MADKTRCDRPDTVTVAQAFAVFPAEMDEASIPAFSDAFCASLGPASAQAAADRIDD